MSTTARSFKYAIIGNSTGAVGCIEAIRERTSEGSIAVVSSESHHVYGRPVISYWLSREASDKALEYRSRDFYEKNNATTFLGKTVTKIDTTGHILTLDDGTAIQYSKLLISVGGAPIAPPLPGSEKSGVFLFNTLDDARALDLVIHPGLNAVVIGGGLTGLKAAEALIMRDVNVTVVEVMDRLMGQATDERASKLVQDLYTEHGCRFKLETTVEEILGEGSIVEGVRLASGEIIPCSIVVIAIGVRPRLELLDGTGIEAGRGVKVDSKMRTTNPDIYACGDVAEAYDFLLGENRVLPLLPNAYVGGRVAGINMSGGNKVYDWGTSANSVDFFGFPLASAGKLYPDAQDECLIEDDGGRTYRKVILNDGHIVGMLFAGQFDRIGILLGHMRNRTDVTSSREHLLDLSISNIFLPEIETRTEARSMAR